jgi:hypothetical protein
MQLKFPYHSFTVSAWEKGWDESFALRLDKPEEVRAKLWI